MLLSAAMLVRTSLGREEHAARIEAAVMATLEAGTATPDLLNGSATTSEFGDEVVERLGAFAS
jgi:3-isopropylmalate dehydrogenase